MSRGLSIALAVLWSLAVAGVFVLREPSGTLAVAPLAPALAGLCAALVAGLACTGAGAALLARVAPASLDDDLGWVRALVVGLVSWGLLSLLAASLLGVHTWVGVLLLALLAAGWLLRPPVRLPRPSVGELSVGLVFLVPALICTLSPVTDTDELYYHLALPARMLDQGTMLGGPWMPNGSRPLALHLPWTWLMALGGTAAPRLFHLGLAAALLLAVRRRALAWWGPMAGAGAPLLLLGSTSFLAPLGLAYADVPTALLVLVAADAALAGGLPLLAVAAGGALALKYTAVLGVLPLFVVLGLRAWPGAEGRGRRLGALLVTGLAALAVVAPWWLRNLIEGLHPLFPFAGWQDAGQFPFQFPSKYGMGHGLVDTLLLPWNITMHAEHDSMVFLGRISPAFLALAPVALVAAWRDRRVRLLFVVAALGLGLWAVGTQWLRYLVPLLPIAALALAGGLSRLPRWAAGAVALCWLLGLPANLRPVLSVARDQAPAALGLEPPSALLERQVTAWPAIRWVNEHSPADARVALMFSWQAALMERPWVLGSVEDHVPTRHFLALHGDDALDVLRAQGVTHVLSSRINFLHKAYPFLDQHSFEAWFEQPERQLEALLEDDAVLMFEQGRHAVYAL
jgi:hypothetical protein